MGNFITTPWAFIFNLKDSQLENQRQQQEDLAQHIQESQSLTVKSGDEDEQSANNANLFVAMRKKHKENIKIEEISKLLKKGAAINAKNTRGKTILDIAYEKNYDNLAKFLIKEGGKTTLGFTNNSNNELHSIQQSNISSTNFQQLIQQPKNIDSFDKKEAELYELLLVDGKQFLTEAKLESLNKALKCGSHEKWQMIDFLGLCKININYKDSRTQQSAIDIVFDKRYYDTMLMLLEADSKFPNDFNYQPLDALYEDKEIPDKLKQFVRSRQELHEWIKGNKLYKVQNYVQNRKWSKFLNYQNRPALETASEYANVEILEFLIGTVQLPIRQFQPTEAQLELLKHVNEDGDTLLSIAAKSGKKDNVDFFIRCGFELKHYKGAIDLAWEYKHYDIVLTLLKADSDFPKDFSLDGLNVENQQQLKKFVEKRNNLHELIKNDQLKDIKKFIASSKSKLYLNSQGQSAIFTAIENKKFEIYAFLKSIGAIFKDEGEKACMNKLSTGEKDALKVEMIYKFPLMDEGHILYLISKSKSANPVENLKVRIEKLYKSLDCIPEISIILKVIQYIDYLDIVFDFDDKNIKGIYPTASEFTKGTTDYKDGRIYIAANINENELLGTLAHELTHLAMHILFQNDCNPFDKFGNNKKKVFAEITANIKEDLNEIRRNRPIKDSPVIILASAFNSNYSEEEEQGELIVRIPHILAQYNNEGRRWLLNTNEKIKLLFDYYNDEGEGGIISRCKEFIGNSLLIKPRSAIQVVNENLGEINNIIKFGIHFEEPIDLDNFLKSKQQVFLLNTENTLLSTLSIYDSLIIKNKNYSIQDSLFLKFNSYIKEQDKINKLFYSPVGKVLCIRYPYDSDKKKLSDVLKTLNELLGQKLDKKIIFILESKMVELNEIKIAFGSNYEEAADRKFTLNNLIKESQQKLLEQEVIFQGEKIGLKRLIDNSDQNAKQIIDSETLVRLMNDDKISISSKLLDLGDVNDYYIDRRFRHVHFSKDKIEKYFKKDLLVISGTDSGLEGENILVFDNAELAECKFKELCEQNPGSNIHWLESDSKELTWCKSHGSISNLVQYRIIEKVDKTGNTRPRRLINEAKLVHKDNHDKIFIISDAAGMGKSTVLTSLTMKLKEDSSLWVIRINLNDYTKVLKEELDNRKSSKMRFCDQDINKVVSFLINNLLASQEQSKLKTNFEKELFNNSFNNHRKMALLFDGFDEISPDYGDIVIDLLQSLKKYKVEKLIITTRPNMSEELERALEVFSHVLEPLLGEEPIEFLTKFWTKKLKLRNLDKKYTERLKTYAESIIKHISISINDEEKGFIGIPLHTMMLAEVFQENLGVMASDCQGCKEFLESEHDKPKLLKGFALLDLYKHFVERKFFTFYTEEKKGRDFSKVGERRLADKDYKTFKENHEILALYTLFTENELKELLPQAAIQNFKCLIAEIKNAEYNEGIVDQIIDDKPHFIHSTFADYFASFPIAKKMVEAPANTLQLIDKVSLNTSPIFINSLIEHLDRKQEIITSVLEKPLLLFIIINKHVNLIKSLLEFGYKNWVKKLDITGKSPLHYAVEYNLFNIGEKLLVYANDIYVNNILKHGSFKKAEYENSKLVKLINIQDEFGKTALNYALEKNIDFAFELLLKGASIDSLTIADVDKLINKMLHTSRDSYLDDIYYEGILGAYANQECKYRPIEEKLLSKSPCIFKELCDKDQSRILSYFFVHGRVNIIKDLLGTIADLEHRKFILNNDDNGKTPMDRVNCSGELSDDDRLEITKFLVEDGYIDAEFLGIDCNSYNDSSYDCITKILEAAAKYGHIKTFKYFIAQKKHDCYHLYFCQALLNNQLNIIKYLYENHNKNIKKDGNTALHSACAHGANLRIIKYLIDNGEFINAQNDENQTPLLIEVFSCCRLNVIEYLVTKGANVSMKDAFYNTPLYYAVKYDKLDIINYLLKKGACISEMTSQLIKKQIAFFKNPDQFNLDLVDEKGFPRLHSAIKSCKFEYARFIVRHGADVNKVDIQDKAPLNWASELKQVAIVELLIQYGAFFDKVDCNNIRQHNLLTPSIDGKKIIWLLELLNKLFSSKNLMQELNEQLLNKLGGELKDWGPYGQGYPDAWDGYNPMLLILNARNIKGETLLHIAADTDDEEAINILFKFNYDYLGLKEGSRNFSYPRYRDYQPMSIDTTDSQGNSPLHLASQNGHHRMVSLLLKKGAIFNSKNSQGCTPEVLASNNKHNETVKLLKQTKNLFIGLKDKRNALKAEKYTKKGAYINAKNQSGKTLLHIAVSFPQVDIVQLLLDNGADIKAIDLNKNTPLHIAAKMDKIKNVKLLLKYGAIYNSNNAKDEIPLDLAHDQCYELLEQIDKLFKDIYQGDNPQVIKRLEMIKKNCETGINTIINTRDNQVNTLLHYATESSQFNNVKLLLENGAIFNAQNKLKETPINLTDNQDIITLLKAIKNMFDDVDNIYEEHVTVGIKIITNVCDDARKTLLQYAVASCKWNIVKFLVENGADVNFIDIQELRASQAPQDIIDYLEKVKSC